ncbi:MAG: hypothetical protein GY849_23715 [Deltaproteobacteria bacterium]|nr:hypothetical protein [Deltaproteobacteria bacterium]
MIEYDEFGPEKIMSVYDPSIGMRGVVVIDNTALGPGLFPGHFGGIAWAQSAPPESGLESGAKQGERGG